MNKKYTPWIIVGGMVIWLAVGYNGMNTASLEVDNSWANVQSQYQRRKDLIPNLEATVKKYAEHESQTLTAVTEARAGVDKTQQAVNALPAEAPADEMQMAQYMKAQADAAKALDIYVNAVKEAYPDLKANENFLALQEQLEGTENRIQVARQNYNETVKVYNKKVSSFPNVMISGMFGFQKRSMFQADADAASAPKVFED